MSLSSSLHPPSSPDNPTSKISQNQSVLESEVHESIAKFNEKLNQNQKSDLTAKKPHSRRQTSQHILQLAQSVTNSGRRSAKKNLKEQNQNNMDNSTKTVLPDTVRACIPTTTPVCSLQASMQIVTPIDVVPASTPAQAGLSSSSSSVAQLEHSHVTPIILPGATTTAALLPANESPHTCTHSTNDAHSNAQAGCGVPVWSSPVNDTRAYVHSKPGSRSAKPPVNTKVTHNTRSKRSVDDVEPTSSEGEEFRPPVQKTPKKDSWAVRALLGSADTLHVNYTTGNMDCAPTAVNQTEKKSWST